jgi:SAM-dependent methyltransferase
MEDFDRRQVRGGRDAYERYLRGMDASMRQKVALTAAHLLCVGKVADMGMGSGSGSDALAALYPSLHVVGVDLDPRMVELAQSSHHRPNLEFRVGDVAGGVFAEGSLDGIFDSSVLHHVTSFGGYEHARAAEALRAQARMLRAHGTLIVRDFVAPDDDEEVLLDVPCDDGDASGDPATCSSAALLERFSREFRSLHEKPGFELAPCPDAPRLGWRRYRLRHRLAVEFVLRKDYRTDWVGEVKEEYTYFTQAGFERTFDALGMRVLASTPLFNPWIVRHRFEEKFVLQRLDGAPLDWPATNYLIAGEKVPPREGVRFSPARATAPIGFLQMSEYRDRRTGAVRQLVRRPNVTVDVLPHFESDGDIYVLARMSYPRPILSTRASGASLDGSRAPHYVTEPLNVLQTDKSLGQTVEEMLEAQARIAPGQLRRFRSGATYYPSAGGSQEEVRSVFVEIAPVLVRDELPASSGLSTSGRVRAIEADQILRAAQVGGLPDARLELNVYDLLLHSGRVPTPWLGEEIALRDVERIEPTSFRDVFARPPRRVFERADVSPAPGFLRLECVLFDELDAEGSKVAERAFEFVIPRTLGVNTVACAIVAKHRGEFFLGLDDDDLAAAQCFSGNSNLVVAPAWRIPFDVRRTSAAHAWIAGRLRAEYGVETGGSWELGGPYYPSAGMSPELVYPIAVEVLRVAGAPRSLVFVPLAELARRRDDLQDGHLRIVALRAAHALGVLRADALSADSASS